MFSSSSKNWKEIDTVWGSWLLLNLTSRSCFSKRWSDHFVNLVMFLQFDIWFRLKLLPPLEVFNVNLLSTWRRRSKKRHLLREQNKKWFGFRWFSFLFHGWFFPAVSFRECKCYILPLPLVSIGGDVFLLLLEHLVSIPWYFDQIWVGSKFGKRCWNYRFNGCDEGKQDIVTCLHPNVHFLLYLSPDSWCKSFGWIRVFVAGWEKKHPSIPSRARKAGSYSPLC